MPVDDYQQRVGQRLRHVRLQQGLTLQQVEERSEGRWKAVVVGAYERGHRAISAAKLADLAEFYGVAVSELIPESEVTGTRQPSRVEEAVTLDLAALAEAEDDETREVVSRFAEAIQSQRGDRSSRALTCRRSDVRQLAALLGVPTDRLVEELDGRGLLAPAEMPHAEAEAGPRRRVLAVRELRTEQVLGVYILVDRGEDRPRPELVRLEEVANAFVLANRLAERSHEELTSEPGRGRGGPEPEQ